MFIARREIDGDLLLTLCFLFDILIIGSVAEYSVTTASKVRGALPQSAHSPNGNCSLFRESAAFIFTHK